MKNKIVLLTDFGTDDIYAGLMKGVIAGIAPETQVIDLTHNLKSYNIKQAAFILRNSIKYFPVGTIFLTVIDPGVGSSRKAMAVESNKQIFLGPDNGIFSYVLNDFGCDDLYMIDSEKLGLKKISNTFHGRDVFAPVAALIANETPLSELGHKVNINEIKLIPPPKLFFKENTWFGEVMQIDKFGNIITSLITEKIIHEGRKYSIRFKHLELSELSKTYSSVERGEYLAYTGSSGHLEIGLREGNAAENLLAKEDEEVCLRFVD